MTTFEELFNKSVLEVTAPQAGLGMPSQSDQSTWEAWLSRLDEGSTDRKMAYFDENLDFLLTLRFEHTTFDDDLKAGNPPAQLLSFLAHLQVSYDASYITSLPQAPSPTPELAHPPVPPRSHSIPSKTKSNTLTPPTLAAPHPSIFPPTTPHPIPSASESDRRYVQAQGTPLRSGIWGEVASTTGSDLSEAFALVWSESNRCWVAIFKLVVQVAFIPTPVPDPLLCLTVSVTLREKPVPVTLAREALAVLIEACEDLSLADPSTPLRLSGNEDDDILAGMEEVNLLEGLSGPTFSSEGASLMLPSTRLGASARKQSYALPSQRSSLNTGASSPLMPLPSPLRTAHPTLRKSYRKTLQTVSGFRVRMRTVFVPYFMLPQPGSRKRNNRKSKAVFNPTGSTTDEEDLDSMDLHERELREAGNEEHTVVLCVEIENGGESSSGFAVESVKVTVGGEGAQTRLIGWGDKGLLESDLVFPLLISPYEQYNLLYAVAFMRSPDVDEFSLARGRGLPGAQAIQEMQRAVAIIINGRPFELSDSDGLTVERPLKSARLMYPTNAFPSRWNCVLDLSPQAHQRLSLGPFPAHNEALPTPASPFPAAIPRSRPVSAALPRINIPGSGSKTPETAVAGNKRFTLSAIEAHMSHTTDYLDQKPRSVTSPVNYRTGTSMLNPANQLDPYSQSGFHILDPSTPNPAQSFPSTPNRASYLPPSATVKSFNRGPATTYAPLSPPLPPAPRPPHLGHTADDSISSQIQIEPIPPTPAYPAFPTSPSPSTPHWQGPIASLQSGAVGPSVEIRREKGPNAAGIPPTPGPRVSAAGGFLQMQSQGETLRGVVASGAAGEPIVISVGLLAGTDTEDGIGKIYPLDQFTLDIFVFNRSSWTRRFEVTYPDRRRQRKDQMYMDKSVGVGKKSSSDSPGIIPLANRVRVGPLLPATCQSVRMDFLALTPGVHSVDVLTLTDVQSGYSMNLRSVMDIVVHEHEISVDVSSEIVVD